MTDFQHADRLGCVEKPDPIWAQLRRRRVAVGGQAVKTLRRKLGDDAGNPT